jgi:methionine--tRNA ligase beta chain
MINIDELKKVELKVSKVLSAERVEGSEKLLKLEVDLGSEKRQIIAGIGKVYNPEDLIGKEVIIVANLEPRSLMGLESQGMVLAANGETGPVLLIPEKEVVPGTEIR